MYPQVNEEILTPARRLLWYIQEHIDPQAVICGGFCRDLLTGRIPKDVDVWLYNNLSSVQLRALSPEVKVTQSIYLRESTAMQRIIRVEFRGLHFDVIQLKDRNVRPHERFDFGINQVWHDGIQFQATPEFYNDVNNKTLTYLETEENFDRFERIRKDRVPRMLAKFPDHALCGVTVGPDGLLYPNSSPTPELFQARKLAKIKVTPIPSEEPPKPKAPWKPLELGSLGSGVVLARGYG